MVGMVEFNLKFFYPTFSLEELLEANAEILVDALVELIAAFPSSDPTEEELAQLEENFTQFLDAITPLVLSIPAASNAAGIELFLNDPRSVELLENWNYLSEKFTAFSTNTTGSIDFVRSSNFTDALIKLIFDGIEAAMIIQNEFTPQTTTTTSIPEYY